MLEDLKNAIHSTNMHKTVVSNTRIHLHANAWKGYVGLCSIPPELCILSALSRSCAVFMPLTSFFRSLHLPGIQPFSEINRFYEIFLSTQQIRNSLLEGTTARYAHEHSFTAEILKPLLCLFWYGCGNYGDCSECCDEGGKP